MRIEVQNLWASTLTSNFIFKVINKVFPKVNHSGATDTAEHERKWRPVTERAERIRTGAFHPLYSHPCPQSYGKPTEHLKCARYMLGTNPTQPELCWVHTGYQSYSAWALLGAHWVPILLNLSWASCTLGTNLNSVEFSQHDRNRVTGSHFANDEETNQNRNKTSLQSLYREVLFFQDVGSKASSLTWQVKTSTHQKIRDRKTALNMKHTSRVILP